MKYKRFSLSTSRVFILIAFIYANFLSIPHIYALGILKVDSITPINTSAIADNTFTNGWKWVFNITVPDSETVFKMKFEDLKKGESIIPVGGNMRIYTEQSINAKSVSPITISSSNLYSERIDLIPSADLNTTKDGFQMQVIVEVKVPTGSLSGIYTTSYGVYSDIPNKPYLKILSPNGGETFASGSENNTISWEAENTGKFTINIVSESGIIQRHIAELTSDKRSTVFTVPIVPVGKYKLYIDGVGIADYTDEYFNITTTAEQAVNISETPAMLLIFPNGNENLKVGENHTLRWASSAHIEKVTVNMESESGDVKMNIISDKNANQRSATFTVPNVHIGKYKMYITNGPITDYTDDYFNIVNP